MSRELANEAVEESPVAGELVVYNNRFPKAAAAFIAMCTLFVVLIVVTSQRPPNPKATLWPMFLLLAVAWTAGIVHLLYFIHRSIRFGATILVRMTARSVEVPWEEIRMIAWREVRQPTIIQVGPGFRTAPAALIVLQRRNRPDEWYLQTHPKHRPAVLALLDRLSQQLGVNVELRPNPNDGRLHEWSVTRPGSDE